MSGYGFWFETRVCDEQDSSSWQNERPASARRRYGSYYR